MPVVLLTSPQYVHTVLAGLTEPLFGLCAVLVVWALMERWHTVAMKAGFSVALRATGLHGLRTLCSGAGRMEGPGLQATPWLLTGCLSQFTGRHPVRQATECSLTNIPMPARTRTARGDLFHFFPRVGQDFRPCR